MPLSAAVAARRSVPLHAAQCRCMSLHACRCMPEVL